MAELDELPVGFRLVIDVAAPSGYRDRIEISEERPDGLESQHVEINGIEYERYGEQHDYVEIRQEWIVSRSLSPVYREKEDTPPIEKQMSEPVDPRSLARRER